MSTDIESSANLSNSSPIKTKAPSTDYVDNVIIQPTSDTEEKTDKNTRGEAKPDGRLLSDIRAKDN